MMMSMGSVNFWGVETCSIDVMEILCMFTDRRLATVSLSQLGDLRLDNLELTGCGCTSDWRSIINLAKGAHQRSPLMAIGVYSDIHLG